jgi:hypothetical protein
MSRPSDEGTTGALAALHNCGAGPREVFRTAAIGHLERFDLEGAYRAWDRDELVVRTIEESAEAGGGCTMMSMNACLTAAVLRELGVPVPLAPEADRDGQARRLLRTLIDVLRDRGALGDLTGIAFHEQRAPAATQRPAPGSGSALEMGRTLAVYAAYSPPLLLWSRSPSLRWLRHDTLIALRRFDPPAAPGRGS